jgi:hypothetical protein
MFVFIFISVILFFLAGIGVNAIPNIEIWALFCFALGHLPWPNGPWPWKG